MQKTKYYSWKKGNLAKGCQLCIKGQKMVLFITGLCHKHCYFCPISEKKFNKDVFYINELKTNNLKKILEETKKGNSLGCGITGGDPLMKIKRTTKLIKFLKKTFKNKFHIHLYTPLELVNESNLKQLNQVGLDEIRFHPSLDSNRLWNKISLANKFKWGIGVEIPLLPNKEKEIKQLCDFIDDKVDFLNLNELEVSDTNSDALIKMGFKIKSKDSFAVKGSEKLGLKILKYCKNKHYNIQLCTAKLKDKIQFTNRIIKYAQSTAKPYDLITKEGMLKHGAIYTKNPKTTYNLLIKKFKVPKKLLEMDNKNKRILTGDWIVLELKDKLKQYKLAIIEQYPTAEKTEIEVTYL